LFIETCEIFVERWKNKIDVRQCGNGKRSSSREKMSAEKERSGRKENGHRF
jgi:hypothetical protein